MGIWRTLYYLAGWVYIGEKEQIVVDRVKHLKYLVCQQIQKSDMKLNRVVNTNSDRFKSRKKRKK